MHFWIDKRSQTYGFGRARVAASLSGGGLGFGHHPRRIGGKPMVTPIHRFQPIDSRPYAHRQNHHYQLNGSHHPQQHTSNHQQQHQAIHQHQHQHQHHQQHHQTNQHHHYHQNQQSHSSQSQSYNHRTHNVYHSRNHYQAQSVQHNRELECPIQQIDSVELEQGSLGINSLVQARSTVSTGNSVTSTVTADSQVLPSHLKCGLWASLALATVFLAVFQGTGLEVLIFCAFSATFFLAACTVSLCRRPRTLHLSPELETANNEIEQISPIQQHTSHVTDEIETNGNINTISAPPPPYHIAILVSDNVKIDESPPPSYDKLLI